jgi:peptide/nickel transport system substrate-binding protein
VVDSKAVQASFERFSAVKGGPSYMLAQVASYETPDATTFIINLKSPVDPFLHFIASPYGPRLVSPAAVKANEKDGDLAQDWLKTHDGGTGPYQIVSWQTSEYKLAAYPGYWGEKPSFKNVDIKIIASFQTQQLQLQEGTLDILVNGVLPRDIGQLELKGLKTFVFDTPVLDLMWVNTDQGIFADPKVRQALPQALDRAAMVKTAFLDTATVAKTMAPKAMLPAGTATYEPAYDPQILRDLVSQLPASERKVSIIYATQDTVNQQMADLVQTSLADVGLDATAQGMPLTEIWTWMTNPENRADLLIQQSNGDGANPYTWYSLFYAKNGGLSFMTPTVCGAADQLVEEAFGTGDPAAATALYVKADEAYVACGAFVTFADTKGLTAYRADLTGLEHPYCSQTTVTLAKVRPVSN